MFVLRDAHRPAEHDAASGAIKVGYLGNRWPLDTGAVFDFLPGGGAGVLGKRLKALRGLGHERCVDGPALEDEFGQSGKERQVAANVRLDVEAGNLRTEKQAPNV